MAVIHRSPSAVGCPVPDAYTLVCYTLEGEEGGVGHVDHADNIAWDGADGIGRVETFEVAPFIERRVPERCGPYLLRAFQPGGSRYLKPTEVRPSLQSPGVLQTLPDGEDTVIFPTSSTLGSEPRVLSAAGYESLADVLARAFEQAASGKGAERHAKAGEPFDAQVMADMAKRFGVGSLLGQAFKKSEESQRLPTDRAVRELLGAINYLAGAVIALERGQ